MTNPDEDFSEGSGGGPSVGLERLWAGWRTGYIERVSQDSSELRPDESGLSLFERICTSDLPDEQTHVLWRGPTCFAVLNAYPYGSGHLMVLPRRAVPDLAGLTPEESTELWETVRHAVAAIDAAYRPEGVNVGINIGAGAGAGVPGHIHIHCLPRWHGDTNFMTTVAETRVLPEPLSVSWKRLREAWPSDAP